MSTTIRRFCSAARDRILRFDYLGPGPEIVHLGESKFHSWFGLFVSIFAIGITITSQLEMFEEVFTRIKPDFTIRKTPLEEPIVIDNNPNHFQVYFTINIMNFQTKKMEVVPIPTNTSDYFLHIELLEENENNIKNLEFENKEKKKVITEPLMPCSQSTKLTNYNDYLYFNAKNKTDAEIDKIRKVSYCIPEYLNFTIDNLHPKNFLFQVTVRPDLLKLKEIKESEVMFLSLNYLRLEFNLDNVNNPYKLVWMRQFIHFQKNNFISKNVIIQKSTIELDDAYFIVPRKTEDEYDNVEKVETLYSQIIEPKLVGKSPLAIVVFRKSDFKTEFEIEYKNFGDLLADVGGTLDLINLFCEYIVGLVVTPFFTASMVNKVFDFHSNEFNSKEILDIFKKYKIEGVNDDKDAYGIKRDLQNELVFKNNDLEHKPPGAASLQQVFYSKSKDQGERFDSEASNLNKAKESQGQEIQLINEDSVGSDNKNKVLVVEDNKGHTDGERGEGGEAIEMIDYAEVKHEVKQEEKQEDKQEDKQDKPETGNINSEVQFVDSELTYLDFKEKKKGYKKREYTGASAFKLMYCECCSELETHEKILKSAIDFYDRSVETSEIIKTWREIRQLKYLLLNHTQRDIYRLPSVNVNDFENTKEILFVKEDDEEEEEKDEEKIKQMKQQEEDEKDDLLKKLDSELPLDRKLARAYVRSYV